MDTRSRRKGPKKDSDAKPDPRQSRKKTLAQGIVLDENKNSKGSVKVKACTVSLADVIASESSNASPKARSKQGIDENKKQMKSPIQTRSRVLRSRTVALSSSKDKVDSDIDERLNTQKPQKKPFEKSKEIEKNIRSKTRKCNDENVDLNSLKETQTSTNDKTSNNKRVTRGRKVAEKSSSMKAAVESKSVKQERKTKPQENLNKKASSKTQLKEKERKKKSTPLDEKDSKNDSARTDPDVVQNNALKICLEGSALKSLSIHLHRCDEKPGLTDKVELQPKRNLRTKKVLQNLEVTEIADTKQKVKAIKDDENESNGKNKEVIKAKPAKESSEPNSEYQIVSQVPSPAALKPSSTSLPFRSCKPKEKSQSDVVGKMVIKKTKQVREERSVTDTAELQPKRNLRTKKVLQNLEVTEVAKKNERTISKAEVTENSTKQKVKAIETRSSSKARGLVRSNESKNLQKIENVETDTNEKNKEVISEKLAKEPSEPSSENSIVNLVPSPAVLKPSPISLLCKTLRKPEEKESDPYSFEMSQSDVVVKKVVKKAKQVRAKQKPGSKIDLLIKQQELEAVEYSCTVQNNPMLYKNQRVNIEKQLNKQLASAPKVVLNLEVPKEQPKIPEKVMYSKVWHSPQLTSTSKKIFQQPDNMMTCTSPNIPLQLVQAITRNQSSIQASTPLRVPESLPSAFYMGLSKNDGTPTYSSDMLDGDKSINYSSSETNRTLQAPQENLNKLSENVPLQKPSFLENSNTENIKPAGYKSPNKKVAFKVQRSPFKPLSLETSAMSPMNNTIEKTLIDEPWNDNEDSVDLLTACEQAEKMYSKAKQTQSSVNSSNDDTFGFDDLLDGVQPLTEKSPTLRSVRQENIHEKLQNMKRYLPSNKNRGEKAAPSSPVKKLKILGSPSKASEVDVRHYFSASTPVSRLRKVVMEEIVESPELSSVEESVSKADETNIELFEESLELQNTKRIYGRKRAHPNPRDDENSDEEDEVPVKPDAMKPSRKKFNIEETGAFKKFVHDKSNEFAEVDAYEMVIE